jgi:hypothetical protein
MIATTAGTPKAETLADQIAQSALGQLYEDKSTGNVNYDDADHREVYLAANGYTAIDGTYATPASVKSLTQVAKIRNSLIYKYGSAYASTYSTSDATSIATYNRYEYRVESNIKNLTDITAVGSRELALRATPFAQFQSITFRLDNASMPSVTRDALINSFFGQPIEVTNLPSNMFDGTFQGFLEGYSLQSTPTYVDLTINLSPAKFSLPIDYGNYTLGQTITATGTTTYTVPSGVNQIAVLAKGFGGNAAAGTASSSTNGGAGGGGGGGAGAAAFWNYAVTPGATYTVNLDFAGTRRVSFGSLIAVTSGTNASGATGGTPGGLYSVDGSVSLYTSKTGTAGGAGGATKTTNGNGNNGTSFGNGDLLAIPANIGLLSNFRAGNGGGGGGGGAKAPLDFYYDGGTGAYPGGGNGGNAHNDGLTNGSNATEPSTPGGGTGAGGNGGGGGAYEQGFSPGSGGTATTPTGAVVYIYTR